MLNERKVYGSPFHFMNFSLMSPIFSRKLTHTWVNYLGLQWTSLKVKKHRWQKCKIFQVKSPSSSEIVVKKNVPFINNVLMFKRGTGASRLWFVSLFAVVLSIFFSFTLWWYYWVTSTDVFGSLYTSAWKKLQKSLLFS